VVYYYLSIKISFPVALSFFHRGYKGNFATSSKLQQEIKKRTREGDVFVVDRGFRDSIDFLNELGIPIEMPAFLDKGQKQQLM
jgi:hypothetical protein